jgi:PAS domain S-box-containing protein
VPPTITNDSTDAGDNDREQHGRSGRAASNAAASAANASPKQAPRRLPRSLTAALLLAILAAGAFFAWWMAARADREMRADLLQQARLVAQAVNTEQAKALTGTEADLDSSAYQRLKKQFVAVRSANPLCRFVYLMGRKADGTMFFFVDSEPVGSKDYSPPGQVYDEVTASLLQAFDAKVAVVDGPAADRWGTWVSALVPITDPQTGAVIVVLGMDVDARAFKWDVAARAALPVGLMLVLLIGLAAAFVSTRKVDASPRPVLRRLLPPLAAMVVVLTASAGAILWQQHQRSLAGEIAAGTSDIFGDLRVALNQEASGLAMAAQPIAGDATVQKALREGDADRLQAAWRPVFETMHRENHLTHFYFFDKNRICLLRVHKPEKRGDVINRFTALEAQRTGKTASGIELGPLGTFTLRVVQPVFEGGALVGYVELGKEIEEVLDVLHTRFSVQLAVVIRKEHLKRQDWEDGMRLLGREADWDRITNSAVAYASQGRLPDAFALWANYHAHGETNREIAFDGKDWRVSSMPLQDVSGKEVGDLLVMRDITADNAAFACLTALGGTAGAVLLALLLGWIYVLLRRTDRSIRAQQAELRESEMRHRLLFDGSRDAMMTLGPPSWKFTSGNPAAVEMFGAGDAAEFTARGPWDVSPQRQPDGRPSADKAREMIETAMREGSNFFEWTHRRLDGADFPATVLLTKTEIAGQAFLQATVRDITAQKRAETDLRETNRQLERAVSLANEMVEQATTASVTKSEFLANMSHEIRTPLTAILGYSELLMDEGTSPQERKEHSRVILRNGKHLLELVNDILDISKIEADKLVLERRPCSVHAIVAGVVSMMRVRAIKKNLALTARYVTPMPQTIMTDEARLRQALLNLVGNAIKFTEAGEVSISVSLVQGQQDTPPIIRIDVRDTGIGISAETLGHLFHPFTQADSSTTRKFGGTGLGLTITKRIIEKMGGHIQVQSTPGKGSTFTLIVPTGSLEGIDMVEQTAEAMAPTPEPPHQPERAHPLQGLRILLAEDGPDNQLLIRTVLSKAGAEVEVADNGLLAVHAATARPFDLVLMDIQMPEMDGYEATGQLRAQGYEVPIIALTAHALAGDREQCLDAGCTDYLTKPIHRSAMIDLILKHTSGISGISGTDTFIPWYFPKYQGIKVSVPEMSIASRFADDPDMAEVIASFVQLLPQRCQAMREALNNNDLPTLQWLAHQMKGTGGSYGYPMLTQAGSELEAAAKAGDQEACGLELRNLAVMCQAIGRGLKTKDLSQGHPS